jgi:hypothetical protein
MVMRVRSVVCTALFAVAAAVRLHSPPVATSAPPPLKLSLADETASTPTSLWGGLHSFLTLRSRTAEQVVRVPSHWTPSGLGFAGK